MEKCIFCDKQTNNEYSYYKSDSRSREREKVSIFACTRCLRKKSVIILLVISLLFLLSITRVISDVASGKQQLELGPLIVAFVLFFGFSAWTVYIFNCIKTDKPLLNESVAKRLIKKAKRTNPQLYYCTPTENALQPVTKLEDESGEGEDIIEISVNQLVRIYQFSRRGEGFLSGTRSAEPVQQVGNRLNDAGGFNLMLIVHQQFAETYPVRGAARNLERLWDGIGSWQG